MQGSCTVDGLTCLVTEYLEGGEQLVECVCLIMAESALLIMSLGAEAGTLACLEHHMQLKVYTYACCV